MKAAHLLAALACGLAFSGRASAAPPAVSQSGIPAFDEAMLSPDYWIRRAPEPDAVLRDARATAAQRAAAYAPGGGFLDIRTLPATLTRAQVLDWIRGAEQQSPIKLAVDDAGRPVGPDTLQALRDATAAGQVPATASARHGLAVRRAALRTYPSDRTFFAAPDQRDYESLTAGTLFPGEPVLVAHTSADGRWLLAVTTQGPAWVHADDIALGPADTVFGYAALPPGRVVTGDHVHTVFTPEAPAVSQLDLDMGVALPRADVLPDQPVNGASPYASWAVQLPVRRADGTLTIQPALIRRSADTAPGYLPLTRANIIRQSFKLLGERYGWGHQFDARDCSGLVAETYRSMGLLLQHSSGLQGTSTALEHRTFTATDSHAARVQAVREAQVGDLVVVPGHVLMIIGHVNGEPYVIQDVPYAVFKDPATGALRGTKLNQVSVTPLLPLHADDTTLYVDAMTSLVQPTRGQAATTTSAPHDGQHDFDWEIGNWDTQLKRLREPLSGKTDWVEYTGTSVVKAVMGGRANLVELDVHGSAGRIAGVSLRLYQPASGQWALHFANLANGLMTEPMQGSFKDGRGTFYGTDTVNGRAVRVRFLVVPMGGGQWRFEQAYSADGGQRWETNWIAIDTRRGR
ncbi:hypothetical protein C5614_09930 [Massilia phosphatilytica]|nr:hypothetical protein C5614_09930 [Massilia phosphatilytica]